MRILQSRFLSILFVVLSIQLLSGCASMGPSMEKPRITVTNLHIQEVKALESIFVMELRVMNPNDFALNVQGLNCDLNIDGKHFASGLSNMPQNVPAFGTATVPVTVYASVIDMVGSVLQMLQDSGRNSQAVNPLNYELSGKLRLGGGRGKTIPFQSEGELNLGGQNYR
ncbi:MAG: LEA type 2 family protein [Thermodesulfobacteriota bacterium]